VRPVGITAVGKGSKLACTVSLETGAFPPFSLPLQPMSAANR